MITDSIDRYPVIPPNRKDDLHGIEYREDADLVIFMAGNQFMVMEELLSAFKQEYPSISKIFYETLPPGLELKQILAGGAIFKDELLDTMPDVYSSVNIKAMETLTKHDKVAKGDYFIYLHNRITLMVPKENPAKIRGVIDLSRDNVRISQPNPEVEDIAYYIINMYRETGGDPLVYRIMEEKRAEGTTIFTIVHHRETPLRITKGTVDVGPVWATEIFEAKKKGLPIEEVAPGREVDQRDKINYYICRLKEAKHPENAEKFLNFIKTERAKEIYKKYGFITD